MTRRRVACMVVSLASVMTFVMGGCKPEVTGAPLDNIPPAVRLPNSMADSMYLPATALIKWIGDDPDGIVVGYSHRIDLGKWSHEADPDGDWTVADDLNGNGVPDRNWDGGFGLMGVDDDGDSKISALEDSSRYYGYAIYADEELPNGIDDDGDGRTDEDCWGNDADGDLDCGYDPEPRVDEDPIDGIDNDGDGLVDEDPIVRPRWVRAMGLAGEWTFWSSATQDTIRFPAELGSQGQIHRFHVKCLDNQKAESSPRTLTVFTTTYLPTPEIIGGPIDGANVFMSSDTSGAWKGVRYDLGGTDIHRDVYYNTIEDGRVTKWAYWLDDPGYRPPRSAFGPEPQAVLFNVADGSHTLYVQCMDNSGAVSDSVAMRSFVASNPTFGRGVLLVDDAYYRVPAFVNEPLLYEGTLLAGRDVSRLVVPDNAPMSLTLRPADLADFKALWWVRAAATGDSLLATHKALLADYVRLGGKVVLEGTRINESFVITVPATFEEGAYAYDWLGLAGLDEPAGYSGGYVFNGANAVPGSGYPSVRLVNAFPRLPFTATATPRPGAEPIMTLASADTTVHGRVNAIRFVPTGTSAKVLFFGFPLMYLEPEDLAPLGAAIQADLGL